MKMLYIKLCFLVLLQISSLYAGTTQDNLNKVVTTYEKARQALSIKAMEKLVGYVSNNQKVIYQYAIEECKSSNSYDLLDVDTYNFMVATAVLSNEDFDYEKAKLLSAWYESEVKKLEKTRTKYDYQREAQRNSTLGFTSKWIKQELITWAAKGEYEKTVDYEKRLRENCRHKYDSLVVKETINLAKTIKGATAELQFDEYNADTEIGKFCFVYRRDKELIRSGKFAIKTLPSIWKEIKEIANSSSRFDYFVVDVYQDKGHILPRKLLIIDKNTGTFITPELKGKESYLFVYEPIGNHIVDAEMRGYSFSVRDYWNNLEAKIDTVQSAFLMYESYVKKYLPKYEVSLSPLTSSNTFEHKGELGFNFQYIRDKSIKSNEYDFPFEDTRTMWLSLTDNPVEKIYDALLFAKQYYVKNNFQKYRRYLKSDEEFIEIFAFEEKGNCPDTVKVIIKEIVLADLGDVFTELQHIDVANTAGFKGYTSLGFFASAPRPIMKLVTNLNAINFRCIESGKSVRILEVDDDAYLPILENYMKEYLDSHKIKYKKSSKDDDYPAIRAFISYMVGLKK